MCLHPSSLTGPDFLEHVADAEEALGNEINAAEYRRRAKQWTADQAELEGLRNATQPLANRRRTSQLPSHHITPSDSRRL